MITGTDYRVILRRELETRKTRNSGYSLRAFAKQLGLDPARLSLILNNKQGLSEKSATRIAVNLGYSAEDRKYFCDLVLLSDARAKASRRMAKMRIHRAANHRDRDDVRVIQEDTFIAISQWYHFAILELTSLKSFRNSMDWIAKRLGISRFEATQAVTRLKRLGLLMEKGGSLTQTDLILSTTQDIPSAAIRAFNHQMLRKAGAAIDMQSLDEREISTLTIAIDSKNIPKIKEKIRKFRRELNREIESKTPPETKDAVYCLATQLFRLTEAEQIDRSGELR
jgi:uncharacterized protein (TIGR02147 family)